MNAYAALYVGSLLTIPAALLYRVLNPLTPTPKPYRRVVGGLQKCDIRHIQEAWADKPPEALVAHYDREAELDRLQLAEEAKTAAEVARAAAAKQAEQAVWDASLGGRVVNRAMNIGGWVVGFICALPFILILAAFMVALFGIPALIMVSIFGLFSLKLIGIILLISWCLNDFKNDIADEVIARQKSEKID